MNSNIDFPTVFDKTTYNSQISPPESREQLASFTEIPLNPRE